MSKSINEWAHEVHEVAKSKGWHDDPVRAGQTVHVNDVGAKLMLVVSEVAEACEELRNSGGRLPRLKMHYGPDGKPEGFDVECADAIIRILDLVGALGLDIESAMLAKHTYNKTRPQRHGGKSL